MNRKLTVIFIFLFILFSFENSYSFSLEPENGFVKIDKLDSTDFEGYFKINEKCKVRAGNGYRFPVKFKFDKNDYVKEIAVINDWVHVLKIKELPRGKKIKKKEKTIFQQEIEVKPKRRTGVYQSIDFDEFFTLYGPDSELNDEQRKIVWKQRYRRKRIVWSGVFNGYTKDAGKLVAEFFVSAVTDEPDVVLYLPDNQKVMLDMLKTGQFVSFSGELKDYPKEEEDIVIRVVDGKIIN